MTRLNKYVFVLATPLLWWIDRALYHVHDPSLRIVYGITDLVAALFTWGALLITGFAIVDWLRGWRRKKTGSVLQDVTTDSDGDIETTMSENPGADQAKQSDNRYYSMRVIFGLVALLAYFPVARYIQVLTPGRFWELVLGVSAAGAVGIHLSYTRRVLKRIDRPYDRIFMMLLPTLLLIPCMAIAVRLLNTAPGLLRSPSLDNGKVVGRSAKVYNYTNGWNSYSVNAKLDSGRSVSVDVSWTSYCKLPIGTFVQVQTRAGLLGLSWCLGDCVTLLPAPEADR